MATTRQIAAYVCECVGAHLAPDALAIKRWDDATIRLVTRKPGTANEPGDVFLIRIERQAPESQS